MGWFSHQILGFRPLPAFFLLNQRLQGPALEPLQPAVQPAPPLPGVLLAAEVAAAVAARHELGDLVHDTLLRKPWLPVT